MATNGVTLLQQAEVLYSQHRIPETFEYYQLAIKKILENENVTSHIPAIIPPDYPQETLGYVWRSFVGFFRDPEMSFDQDTAPEAFKLLNSFKPSSPSKHRQFKSQRAKVLLKGMQISAGLTLGVLAWDKLDRATAAKRYQESLDLADTHPLFIEFPIASSTMFLERWVAEDISHIRHNLETVVACDVENARNSGQETAGRREIIEVRNFRVEGPDNEQRPEEAIMMATDVCGQCKKRGVKLQKCSICKKICYCNKECQKADWRTHKVICQR